MKEEKKVVLVIGAVMGLLFALLACGWGGLLLMVALSQPEESGAVDGAELERQKREREKETSSSPSTADRPCTLRIPGEPSMRVPVFEEESDYDDWSKAAANEDVHGQAEAIRRSGMLVESGTSCKRLSGFFSARVRILSGPFEGRAGWTPSEWTR